MNKWVFFGLWIIIFLSILRIVMGQSTGQVSLEILSDEFLINITHPLNITYNLVGSSGPYPLDLNVTSTFPVESWKYSLYEPQRLRKQGEVILGGDFVYINVSFVPNATLNAIRYGNYLTVYANNSAGQEVRDNEIFYVQIDNSAPQLSAISDVYLCEGTSSQDSFVVQSFSAIDVDENDLEFDIEGNTGICSLFFIDEPYFEETITPYLTNAESRVFTGNIENLSSGSFGSCRVNVSVGETDGSPTDLADRKEVNLTVIEVNSPPRITNPLGVQTKVWSQGENSSLEYDFNATDDESIDENLGLLNFNISFNTSLGLFGITPKGFINFSGNQSVEGVYNVRVCVTDPGLEPGSIHPLIQSQCGQNGLNQSSCSIFELTVTDENRPPEIINYYPNGSTFIAGGTTAMYFNVTERDPDGTTPDTYWYVDNVLKEYDSGSLFDEFSYTFGCGVNGEHFIRVDATDGLLNDTFTWNVSVVPVPCLEPDSGGGGSGGGGGGGGALCIPRWGCYDWSTCRQIDSGLASGEINGETYRELVTECDAGGYRGDFCGFQERTCFDTVSCNRETGKPKTVESCHFTENPSCFDRIKNCHDGQCEFLVDCGGTCGACATCSDGLQNQGEAGIDCGGPCPGICPIEQPLIEIPEISIYWKLGIMIFLLVVIAGSIRIYVAWKKSRREY